MTQYEKTKKELLIEPKTWLITGVAGFIGSNLLEYLLKLNQKVVGLDNFATGYKHNLDEVKDLVSSQQWKSFRFIEGDIRNYDDCQKALAKNIDYVLHQAALGSVPRSIADPLNTNSTNITGFMNILESSRQAKVKSFIYAASSSTYGDHPALPKVEENIGNPLSPYAVTKYVNELYAGVYNKSYNFNTIGLRYFNVFGKRQNPEGDYAAVIPRWIEKIKNKEYIYINGDGDTSRDFCFIKNVIQANIMSAVSNIEKNEVINIAVGERTSLNQLYKYISKNINGYSNYEKVKYLEFRKGDVRHSHADITKASKLINYEAKYDVKLGLEETIKWFMM